MVKEFKLVLNAPAQGVFFPGSEVSGILVVKVDEPKSYKNIQVTLVGQAHVSWSESSGSGNNRTIHTYTSNETYQFEGHFVDKGAGTYSGTSCWHTQLSISISTPSQIASILSGISINWVDTVLCGGKD